MMKMINFPVKPERDASVSASLVRNCNTRTAAKKLQVETKLLQPFNPERAFSHHAGIASYKGKLYIMWSSGRVHEDDCGQRVMWTFSDNFSDWQPPMVLSDTETGCQSEFVKFAGGFCATDDCLYAYFSVGEFDPKYMLGSNLRPKNVWENTDTWLSWRKYVCRLNDDGVTWSDPIAVAFGAGNHSAECMANGRYIIPMATGVLYCDKIESDTVPSFKVADISKAQLEKAARMGAPGLCEASAYQSDDGILHLLMRSGENRLWYAESYDNGETFSDVYPTAFTDDLAKFQFGRLPDGRYYYVGNPVVGQGRLPLMLYVSFDGFDFNKRYIIHDEPYTRRQNGMDKGGHYGYPECVVANGYMYCVYSKQKEVIEITRFSLDQID